MSHPTHAPSDALPQSGYLLEHLYANDLHLSVERPLADSPSSSELIRFGWDWEIIDTSSFEVRVLLAFDPSQDRFERVRLTLSGRFRVTGSPASVELEPFARLHAVAILFPYAREILSTVTARGFYGPLTLPALNVVQLMQDKDPAQTTAARQIAEGTPLPGASPASQAGPEADAPHAPPRSPRPPRGRPKRGPTSPR